MPTDPATGFLIVVLFLLGATVVTLFGVLGIDDFVKVCWAGLKFVGRFVVLVVTAFQVWLDDKHDRWAGALGGVVVALFLAVAINQIVPLRVFFSAAPALLSGPVEAREGEHYAR